MEKFHRRINLISMDIEFDKITFLCTKFKVPFSIDVIDNYGLTYRFGPVSWSLYNGKFKDVDFIEILIQLTLHFPEHCISKDWQKNYKKIKFDE